MLPGETIQSGAPDTCPDCETKPDLQIHRSAAGYYIGTFCKCGPYSRESGYYRSFEKASSDLKSGLFGR